MQWTGIPVVSFETATSGMEGSRILKESGMDAQGVAATESCPFLGWDSNRQSAAGDGSLLRTLEPLDGSLLRTLEPLDRSGLYDLAELLLSELIPGWDEDSLDEDYDEDEEDDEEDCLQLPISSHYAVDPVVDASYRACIQEAESFLVHREGFDVDGSVVVGLRQHLHQARLNAAAAAAAPPAAVSGQSRQRPPGYP